MEDAKNALNAGEGTGFAKYREWIKNKVQPTADLDKFPQINQ